MEEKKKSNKGLIVVIVILIIALLGLGFYILVDKNIIKLKSTALVEEKETKKESDKEDSKENESDQSSDLSLIGFDSENCINNKGNNYSIAYYAANGLSASLSKDKKSVTFSVNWKFYGPVSGASAWSNDVKNYTINNFSQEVVDIYIGGFGQSVGSETLFYLMKDGTVEYTPVKKAINYNNVISFGKLEGVQDVVKFYQAYYVVQTGGGNTMIAQKADGTFYDLYPIIKSTGNY